jgi:mono/diheme cytochrome c family protein
MRTQATSFRRLALVAALLLTACGRDALAQADVQRGLYLSKAAGCIGCHTSADKEAPAYAGGRALKTGFGTFYGPNITPHPQAGIGRWTEADFIRAMRNGQRPDGAHYYPSFPYASFTKMSDTDLKDLWAYLRSVPANARANQPHELRSAYRWRFLVTGWRWLFFTPGPYASDPKLTPILNRGAYLVQALSHCGECHTPRNFLGGPKRERLLAGAKDVAPNITPTRLRNWSDGDLKEFFSSGLTPDGDMVAETMAEVIENTTSQLSPQDIEALIAYLRTVPPQPVEK